MPRPVPARAAGRARRPAPSEPMTIPADGPTVARRPDVWIRRVRIRNYRSIAYCDVELKPLTVLVGRNGSGKSNFVDAIMFVKDVLRTTFSEALSKADRGGFRSLLYLGSEPSDTFSIELELIFADRRVAIYGVEIGDPAVRGYPCVSENLSISDGEQWPQRFRVEEGRIVGSSVEIRSFLEDVPFQQFVDVIAQRATDRPRLIDVAAVSPVGFVQVAIQGAYAYALSPGAMRLVGPSPDDDVLARDGGNVSAVMARLQAEVPETVAERISAYLHFIVPGIESVQSEVLSAYKVLTIRQATGGRTWTLYPHQMSDGTLRAIGSLVAVAQETDWGPKVRIVAIEEPETAIHPAAVRALVDAFDEATVEKQVIITTHSPDVLDRLDFDEHQVLAVETDEQGTKISAIDQASREAIKERLSTPGQLLQTDFIETDWRDVQRQRALLPESGANVSS